MFNLFSWITNGVREAVTNGVREAILAGFCQAVHVIKTGEPADSAEARHLLELTGQEAVPEPLGRLLEQEANGKRAKTRATASSLT